MSATQSTDDKTRDGAGHVLDDPVWNALHGPHRQFAIGTPRALRYRPDVSPFAALNDVADPEAWHDLGSVVAPGDRVAVSQLAGGRRITPPFGWVVLDELQLFQMVGPTVEPADDAVGLEPMVRLGAADVDDMLALVAVTHPGPFGRATVDLGGYLGIRRSGRLVAMAGRRMHTPGWAEVSAVCTHPDERGHGLSRRLVAAVTTGIRHEGEHAFLHVLTSNTGAIRLYESMGFTRRVDTVITVVAPDGSLRRS